MVGKKWIIILITMIFSIEIYAFGGRESMNYHMRSGMGEGNNSSRKERIEEYKKIQEKMSKEDREYLKKLKYEYLQKIKPIDDELRKKRLEDIEIARELAMDDERPPEDHMMMRHHMEEDGKHHMMMNPNMKGRPPRRESIEVEELKEEKRRAMMDYKMEYLKIIEKYR